MTQEQYEKAEKLVKEIEFVNRDIEKLQTLQNLSYDDLNMAKMLNITFHVDSSFPSFFAINDISKYMFKGIIEELSKAKISYANSLKKQLIAI